MLKFTLINKQRQARGQLNAYRLSRERVCRAKGSDSPGIVTQCVVRVVGTGIQKFFRLRVLLLATLDACPELLLVTLAAARVLLLDDAGVGTLL
jgi:hypothetical protein